MRLTASIMRAAPTSASRRRGIGVGPACASWPVTVTSYQRWPCAPVTTPIGLPRRLEDRPLLDMRLEIGGDRSAAGRFRAGEADPLELGAERDSRHIVRPRQPSARSKTPANTPEPTIAGEKREPSSLVHATTSTGASVS